MSKKELEKILKNLLRSHETETVEFKEEKNNFDIKK